MNYRPLQSTEAFLQRGIGDLMQRDVPVLPLAASAKEAQAAFKQSKYGILYLTDPATGALKGVITGCDWAKAATTEGVPASAGDFATKEKVIAVREDAQLWQLLKIINGENSVGKIFERLPVLDGANRPIGIVDRNSLRMSLSSYTIPSSGSAFSV